MRNGFTTLISSLAISSTMLVASMTASADTAVARGIDNVHTQQISRTQDQTQFHNRQRLERRINGGTFGDAVQQRNRYQHRLWRRNDGQSMGLEQNRTWGAAAGLSGRRMAGSRGGGRY